MAPFITDHLRTSPSEPLSLPDLPLNPADDGNCSIVFACTNFKPCNPNKQQSSPIAIATELQQRASPAATKERSSRNHQRFSNRKRAVRVRSESRPISALYDIICKEKGLDIATTTTNDEDSSSSHHSPEETTKNSLTVSSTNSLHISRIRNRRSHSRSKSRKQSKTVNNMAADAQLANKYAAVNDATDDDDEVGIAASRKAARNARTNSQKSKSNEILMQQQQRQQLPHKSASLPPGSKGPKQHQHDNYQAHNHFSAVATSPSSSSALLDRNHVSNKLQNQELEPVTVSQYLGSASAEQHASLLLQLQQENEQSLAAGGYYNENAKNVNNCEAATVTAAPAKTVRKFRRLRDEKHRRHTDGGGGTIKQLSASLNNHQQQQHLQGGSSNNVAASKDDLNNELNYFVAGHDILQAQEQQQQPEQQQQEKEQQHQQQQLPNETNANAKR